jgi:hypothetical protein
VLLQLVVSPAARISSKAAQIFSRKRKRRERGMTTGTAGQATKQPTPPLDEPLRSGFRPSVEPQEAVAATTVYQVAVYTGDVPNAGTDSVVWLWVDGTRGSSERWLYLDNANNNFERNRTDYFYFNLPDLGTLTAAWINFANSGLSTAWYLSTVTINGRTFSYYNWFDTAETVRLN